MDSPQYQQFLFQPVIKSVVTNAEKGLLFQKQNTEITNIITRQQQMMIASSLLFTTKHSQAKDFSETVQGH